MDYQEARTELEIPGLHRRITEAINVVLARMDKLEAVARSTRELVAAEESKSATATHWGHVYKALRVLDGE